jgi:hypothetical protein
MSGKLSCLRLGGKNLLTVFKKTGENLVFRSAGAVYTQKYLYGIVIF